MNFSELESLATTAYAKNSQRNSNITKESYRLLKKRITQMKQRINQRWYLNFLTITKWTLMNSMKIK